MRPGALATQFLSELHCRSPGLWYNLSHACFYPCCPYAKYQSANWLPDLMLALPRHNMPRPHPWIDLLPWLQTCFVTVLAHCNWTWLLHLYFDSSHSFSSTPVFWVSFISQKKHLLCFSSFSLSTNHRFVPLSILIWSLSCTLCFLFGSLLPRGFASLMSRQAIEM